MVELNQEFRPEKMFENFFVNDLFREFKVDSTHDKLQKVGEGVSAIFQTNDIFKDKKFVQNGDDIFLEILENYHSDLFNNITYFKANQVHGNNLSKTKNTIVPTCDIHWEDDSQLLNLYSIYDSGDHPNLSRANGSSNSFDSATSPDNPRMYLNHTTYTVGDATIAKALISEIPDMSSLNNPDSIYTNITSNYLWQMTLYYCLKTGPVNDTSYKNAIQYLSHFYFQLKKGIKKNKILEYYLNPVQSVNKNAYNSFIVTHTFIWNNEHDINVGNNYNSIYNSFKEFTETISQSNCSQFISKYIRLPNARSELPSYSDVFAEIEANVNDVNTKIYIAQLLKYLGDTSHIVFRNILRRAIQNNPRCPSDNSTTENNAFIISTIDRPLIYRSIIRADENEGIIFPVNRFLENTHNFKQWYEKMSPQNRPEPKKCFGKIIMKSLMYQDIKNIFQKLDLINSLTEQQQLIINNNTDIFQIKQTNIIFNETFQNNLTNKVTPEDKDKFKSILKQVNNMIQTNKDLNYLKNNCNKLFGFNFNAKANELMKTIFLKKVNRTLDSNINPSLVSLNGAKDIHTKFTEYLQSFHEYYTCLLLLKKYDSNKFNTIQIDVQKISEHIKTLNNGLLLRFSKYDAYGLYSPKIDSRETNRINYIKEVIEVFRNIILAFTINTEANISDITQNGNAPQCPTEYSMFKKIFELEKIKQIRFYEHYKRQDFDKIYDKVIEYEKQKIMNDNTKYFCSANSHLDEHIKMYSSSIPQINLNSNILKLNELFVSKVYYYNSKINEFFDVYDNTNEDINNPPIYMLDYLLKIHLKKKYDIYKLILSYIQTVNDANHVNKIIYEIINQHLHYYEESSRMTFYDEFAYNMNVYLKQIGVSIIELYNNNVTECKNFVQSYISILDESSFNIRDIYLDVLELTKKGKSIDVQIYANYTILNNFNRKFSYEPNKNYDGYTPYNIYALKRKIQYVANVSMSNHYCSEENINYLKQFIAKFKQLVYIIQLAFDDNSNQNYFATIIATFDHLEKFNKDYNATYFYEYNQSINEFVEHLNEVITENNISIESIIHNTITNISNKCKHNHELCEKLFKDESTLKNTVNELFQTFLGNLQEYNRANTQCEHFFEQSQNVSLGQQYQDWIREIELVLSNLHINGNEITFEGGFVKAGVKTRGKIKSKKVKTYNDKRTKTNQKNKKKAKTVKHKKKTLNKKKKVSIKKSKPTAK